jgi:DNA-binding NarL/FixJ family response regulator
MNVIKVFIVEDHQIVRDGIRALLLGVSDIKLEKNFANAVNFLDAMKHEQADVVIMDIGLPDINGIDLSEIVKKEYPAVNILILSANTDENSLVKAVKAGVKGFLPKDVDRDELSLAIRKLYAGEKYFSPKIAGKLHDALLNAYDKVGLSEREMEVTKWLSEGYSFKEIGEKLFISERTVETHKNNAIKKLGLRNTMQLVAWYVKQA